MKGKLVLKYEADINNPIVEITDFISLMINYNTQFQVEILEQVKKDVEAAIEKINLMKQQEVTDN